MTAGSASAARTTFTSRKATSGWVRGQSGQVIQASAVLSTTMRKLGADANACSVIGSAELIAKCDRNEPIVCMDEALIYWQSIFR